MLLQRVNYQLKKKIAVMEGTLEKSASKGNQKEASRSVGMEGGMCSGSGGALKALQGELDARVELLKQLRARLNCLRDEALKSLSCTPQPPVAALPELADPQEAEGVESAIPHYEATPSFADVIQNSFCDFVSGDSDMLTSNDSIIAAPTFVTLPEEVKRLKCELDALNAEYAAMKRVQEHERARLVETLQREQELQMAEEQQYARLLTVRKASIPPRTVNSSLR